MGRDEENTAQQSSNPTTSGSLPVYGTRGRGRSRTARLEQGPNLFLRRTADKLAADDPATIDLQGRVDHSR